MTQEEKVYAVCTVDLLLIQNYLKQYSGSKLPKYAKMILSMNSTSHSKGPLV